MRSIIVEINDRSNASAPPSDPDPACERHLAEAAGHLAARRRAVLDWALQSGQRPCPPQPDPPAHEF